MEAAVVYGYFPCCQRGRRPGRARPTTAASGRRFTFPRQRRDRHLCLADFFRPRESGRDRRRRLPPGDDGLAVSRGRRRSCSPRTPTATTWSCTGCRCSSTEALAEYWHAGCARSSASAARTRATWPRSSSRATAASRYSFGYPACPDLEDRAKVVALLEPGADRRGAVRGAPAAPRAVDGRDHRAPPRGEVLQRPLTRSTGARVPAELPPCCSTWTACWSTPSRTGRRRGRDWSAELGATWSAADAQATGRHRPDRVRAPHGRRRRQRRPDPEQIVEPPGRRDGGRRCARGVTWRPGARELLAALPRPGVPSALVSSSYRVLVDAVCSHLAAERSP